MAEWDIVTVLIAIVGLFLAVGNPIIKLNTKITILNEELKSTKKQHDKDLQANNAEHKELWERNDEQDKLLAEHTLRLHDLDGK